MKKRHLSDITADFLKSDEYLNLSNQAKVNARNMIKSIGDTAGYSGNGDYTKWDEDFIVPFVLAMIKELGDGNQYSLDLFDLTFETLQAVLYFLAKTKQIKVSVAKLDKIFDMLKATFSLKEATNFIHEPDDQNPYLPQWQPWVAESVSKYVLEWLHFYEESAAWKNRPQGVDEAYIETLMRAMTEFAYNVYRKTPKNWTKTAICGVMENQLVAKLDFSADEYKLVVPAMTAMLNFLSMRGFVNSKKVENYKRYFAAGEKAMLEAAKDPGNFDPAKLIYQEMKRRGLDPNDQKTVEKFLQELDAKGVDMLSSLFSKSMEEIADEHISSRNNHRWSRKQFDRIERNGIKDGIRLWLDRDKYKLVPKHLKAIDAIALVVSLETRIYSRTLEIPKNWSVETWQMIADSFDASMVREKTIVKTLTQFKVSEKVITQKQADELLTVFEEK
ncbi:hypothetical protein [Companilactobacillus sp. HBUAS56257]|uniref:hypothetical protein n=1 Tax=Companilactobacillus sp. HBUAS56257 TaxID=3109360 RepID=UPI002FF32DEB